MIFLNMYHLNCTLHYVHFIALSHEAKSEWYRTQLAKFCGGRGICTDVTSGAEKFTLDSRIRLRGTGYSWPGLFSGSLQVHSRLNMFTWMMILSYIIKISFQNSSAKHIFNGYMFALQDLVLCATVRRFSTICHVQYS